MKVHRIPLVVALVPLALSACGSAGDAAPAASPVTLRVSTGAPAGTFRPLSEALVKRYAQLLPDVRVEAVDTSGSLRNLQQLQDGTVDVGLAQAGLAHMAYNGRLRETERRFSNIRGIAVLYPSPVHLLVGPRSSIRSVDDLKGRRVSLGRDGAAVTSELVLRGFFPAGLAEEVEGTAGTTAMLLNNTLDAAFAVSSVPSEEVQRHTTAGARLLQMRGPAVVRLRTTFPFFRADVIPAGTYPGQSEPVHTLSVDVVLLVRVGLDAALVRRLTEGFFRMLPQLSAELPFLKRMEPERAPATPVPLHPAAVLYYRERELRR
jgi:TRAP transporter TAXI family solute receptor